MRRCLGTVSKALLMSMAASSVLCAGFDWLRPSRTVCVMFVRSVEVECWGLKPCWEGDRGKCGVMLLSTSLSSILEGVQSNETGLKEEGSVGGFLGFRMGTILPNFQMCGIMLFVMEWLKMSVRTLMACVPRCLRCLLEMPSGPVEEVFLEVRMAAIVLSGVNWGGRSVSDWREWRRRMICRSVCLLGRLDMFA